MLIHACFNKENVSMRLFKVYTEAYKCLKISLVFNFHGQTLSNSKLDLVCVPSYLKAKFPTYQNPTESGSVGRSSYTGSGSSTRANLWNCVLEGRKIRFNRQKGSSIWFSELPDYAQTDIRKISSYSYRGQIKVGILKQTK